MEKEIIFTFMSLNQPLCIVYSDFSIDYLFDKNKYPVHYALCPKNLKSNNDLKNFYESRCIPKERSSLKLFLLSIDVPFYDPELIVRKTNGFLSDDTYWIRFKGKECLTYKDVKNNMLNN